jgi:hypothetical protein
MEGLLAPVVEVSWELRFSATTSSRTAKLTHKIAASAADG